MTKSINNDFSILPQNVFSCFQSVTTFSDQTFVRFHSIRKYHVIRASQNTAHSFEMVWWIEGGSVKTEISIFTSRFLFKQSMVLYFNLLSDILSQFQEDPKDSSHYVA